MGKTTATTMRLALLACAAVILIAAIAYLYNENSALRMSLGERNAELGIAQKNITALEGRIALNTRTINEKDFDIANLTDTLEDTESMLNQTQNQLLLTISELNETQEELANKTLSLEETRQEFSALKTEIADFQQSLQESIEWFKDNSRLSENLGFFASYARTNCVQERSLNLACVSYIMEKRLGFRYISESTDRLYSLDEMVSRGGGDCEDYALFMRAVLNSMNDTTSSVDLLSWAPGEGKFIVFESEDRTWYYNGDKVFLPKLGAINPEAFCYVTGYNGEAVTGHCIVALGKRAIMNESDLQGLVGAQTFEPQDGEYKGTIGNDYHICEDGEISCGKNPGDIIIVMSDDDLYQFRDGEWKSFSRFQAETSEFVRKIDTATTSNG